VVTFFLDNTTPCLHVNGHDLKLTDAQVKGLQVQLKWLIATMSEDARTEKYISAYEHAYT